VKDFFAGQGNFSQEYFVYSKETTQHGGKIIAVGALRVMKTGSYICANAQRLTAGGNAEINQCYRG